MDSLGCFGIRNSDKFILHFNQVCFQIYGMYCIVDSKDNKVDKTREEADMTPQPVFSKIFKSGPKVSKSVLEWSKSIFQVFLTVTHLLDQFWVALDTFGKNGLKVMSASSLVLSTLLSLLSTMQYLP